VRAEAAWTAYDIEVEARWSQLRAGVVGGLSVVQREAIAGDVYRRWLKAYPDGDPSAWSNAFRDLALIREWNEEFPDDDLKMLDMMQRLGVDEELAKRGLALSPSAWWPLLDAANRAAQHVCRYAMQRSQGDMRPDSEAERYPAWPNPATTTLIGLHGKWVINRRPNAETQKAFLSVVKKLVAFVGFDDVSRLTTADVRRWCAALKESGDISDRRIREHYLAAIKAILNSAVTMGYLASNVAAPVKIDVGMEQERRERDLRDGEIYAILRATAGPFEPGLSDDVRAARRWVPWLCAYTGARVAEITRLESRHIIREDGIDGIHIETSKTGRTRKIPIHQDLKDQGFLDFVDARRGQPLFFQESKLLEGRGLTIHRTRAEGVAEWIRRLEGMQEAAVAPQHGWRHRFRTEGRRIVMDREVRNYLMGHAVETVGEGYGHVPLDVSAPWIAMFPTYDISGPELVVHRFDLSLLMQAAARMRAVSDLEDTRKELPASMPSARALRPAGSAA
jgi:integrase